MKVNVVIFSLLGGLIGMATARDGDKPAQFAIKTRKANDIVTAQGDKDRTTFDVTSPSGISHAVITRTGARWPKAVLLRLRLTGLESFVVSNGQITLNAAVSSRAGVAQVRLWKDGMEDAPLGARSPLWMNVRPVGGDGKAVKGLPPRGGYFEMTLPAALFAGDPKVITLKWIDSYRN